MNLWPSGYEPDELPSCSIPRQKNHKLNSDKINIRKADTIYNLLNKNKTSDFSKIIDEVLPLEIGEIEKIIKTPSGRSDKISIKPKKKSIIIEINSLLRNEDIEKIKKFINEFL